jgi:hypothetical protein
LRFWGKHNADIRLGKSLRRDQPFDRALLHFAASGGGLALPFIKETIRFHL